MDVHIPPVVSFVLALLFSVTAGFFYADYGWHNGALFLLIVIVVALTTYELRVYRGSEAVSRLMPTFLNTLVITVVSIFGSFAGISLGNGSADLMLLVYYVVSIVAFGFLSTCLSVNNAVHASDDRFIGPLVMSLFIYVVAFVFGLIAVANDDSSQALVAVGYVVFCVVLSFILMGNASRARTY